MESWQDYYSVLQVHPDAEPEIIQSAYKRLCRKYHPDVNPSPLAGQRQRAINQAYEVLSDSRARAAFHAEWLRRSGTRATRTEVRERIVYVNREPPKPKVDPGTPEAAKVVSSYFSHVAAGRFRDAWALISDLDKQRFSYGTYVEWQESVAALYTIGKFQTRFFKRHDTLKAQPEVKLHAEEYTVTVTEKDVLTNRLSEYSFTKFAVQESSGWKVYLGYRDLTPLLVKFKTMASTQEEALLVGQWDRYKSCNDLAIGLPNRVGFHELLKPEIYRASRYDRPLSVIVVEVSLPARLTDDGHREHILKYIGYLIQQSDRTSDSVAYLGDSLFGLILPETNKRQALLAAKRLLKTVRHDVAACFDFEVPLRIGAAEYSGNDGDALIAACLRTIEASGGGVSSRGADHAKAVNSGTH